MEIVRTVIKKILDANGRALSPLWDLEERLACRVAQVPTGKVLQKRKVQTDSSITFFRSAETHPDDRRNKCFYYGLFLKLRTSIGGPYPKTISFIYSVVKPRKLTTTACICYQICISTFLLIGWMLKMWIEISYNRLLRLLNEQRNRLSIYQYTRHLG